MNDGNDRKALILNIQRMSTEDGPGLRTTVFFKGCSLSCAWCHNPESIKRCREIQWVETRCIGCGTCIKICANGALSMGDKGVSIDRERCIRCMECANNCPALALEIMGEEWETDKLLSEVLKDRAYFEKSGGGVTVSGGEPLVQYGFVSGFLKVLKECGIDTAVDTCGVFSKKALEEAMPYADTVLYDIKIMDPVLHKRFTGQSNEIILKNLADLAGLMRECRGPSRLWIRTPVIPGATAYDDNIKSIGEFIASNISDVVERWDLCAFNNLCRDKYRRLGMEWTFDNTPLLKKDDMEHFAEIAGHTGVNPGIVHWSGATRVKE